MDITVLNDVTLPDGTRVLSVQPSPLVCSSQIDIAAKDGRVVSARFTQGCHGNTQGVCALLEGMEISEAAARLAGINCKGRGTSCPDQLSQALRLLL